MHDRLRQAASHITWLRKLPEEHKVIGCRSLIQLLAIPLSVSKSCTDSVTSHSVLDYRQPRLQLSIKNPLRLHNVSGVVLVPPDKVSASNPWPRIPPPRLSDRDRRPESFRKRTNSKALEILFRRSRNRVFGRAKEEAEKV
jgi:hypothetical protein